MPSCGIQTTSVTCVQAAPPGVVVGDVADRQAERRERAEQRERASVRAPLRLLRAPRGEARRARRSAAGSQIRIESGGISCAQLCSRK